MTFFGRPTSSCKMNWNGDYFTGNLINHTWRPIAPVGPASPISPRRPWSKNKHWTVCKQLDAISVTKCPLVLWLNFSIACDKEFKQYRSRSVLLTNSNLRNKPEANSSVTKRCYSWTCYVCYTVQLEGGNYLVINKARREKLNSGLHPRDLIPRHALKCKKGAMRTGAHRLPFR